MMSAFDAEFASGRRAGQWGWRGLCGAAVGLALVGFGADPAEACRRFPQAPLPTVSVTVPGPPAAVLTAELAQTAEQTSCGLMGRRDWAAAEAMLFDMRPVGPANFWMKNTPMSLDIAFIGEDGRVLHVAEATRPYSTRTVGTNGPVAWVLEVAAGEAATLGLTVGAVIGLPAAAVEAGNR